GTGAMRVGRQANTSIGRFARLYLRNLAGFRAETLVDKGTIGFSFSVALGENEKAIKELGWPPYRVDNGFTEEDNTVTVQSVVAVSPPVYSGGTTADEILEMIVYHLEATSGAWGLLTGIKRKVWEPLIVMSPSIARGLAAVGFGKDEVRRYLYE